ncbi:MAG TPA: ATP-binding protein [Candidatus Nitrosocosmicus sp.]|nr:ATP-binding protein [Candidatus Nitrosocosmicus sp.]
MPNFLDKMEGIGTAEGLEESTKIILKVLNGSTNCLLICADQYWPSVAIGIEVFNKGMFDLKKRNVKCRFITEVTKENIAFCKELLKIAAVHHLPGLKGNFAVNENEYIASATMKNLQLLSQVVYSNSKAVVEQHNFFFENLWDKSISATEKIDEIEKGIVPEIVDVIKNPIEIKNMYFNILKSSINEIMLILTTSSVFLREENDGLMSALLDVSNKNVKIRIITPSFSNEENKLYNLSQKDNIEVRRIESPFDAPINILVVDGKYSLIVELKHDMKQKFPEAVGSAIYSTSQANVLSFVTIFDTLWKQTELYEKLKDAGNLKEEYIKKLRLADKAKDEFVNIAAHELRTPTQSILTFANLLKYDVNKNESIEAIYRNAKRLNVLIKNILDVTKIESNKLILHQENFNLNYLLTTIIKDYTSQLKKPAYKRRIKLYYALHNETVGPDALIHADKERIIQVISNLLDNAIKFIEKDGLIRITLKISKGDSPHSHGWAEIIIKDTGSGISEEILPYLFSKFSTRSFQGTGLGLYISKNIIESHGGSMWAENNKDGRGAIFSFKIPLIKTDLIQNSHGVSI